jgi:hypothetical protein
MGCIFSICPLFWHSPYLKKEEKQKDQMVEYLLCACSPHYCIVHHTWHLADSRPWARWNYSGYENKEGWPVFTQIIDYIKDLEQGRFMVEQDKEKSKRPGPQGHLSSSRILQTMQ